MGAEGKVNYEEMKEATWNCLRAVALFMFWLFLFLCLTVKADAATFLKASWYSEASLKKEGTWRISHGIQANGKPFDETKLTCATRLFPLGTNIKIVNRVNGRSVIVKVTDRIGKRFAKTRIDLSKAAFQKIASLNQGVINIEVVE
jgi:rare lipoprotein A (peptidoglycan hydrolase)